MAEQRWFCIFKTAVGHLGTSQESAVFLCKFSIIFARLYLLSNKERMRCFFFCSKCQPRFFGLDLTLNIPWFKSHAKLVSWYCYMFTEKLVSASLIVCLQHAAPPAPKGSHVAQGLD